MSVPQGYGNLRDAHSQIRRLFPESHSSEEDAPPTTIPSKCDRQVPGYARFWRGHIRNFCPLFVLLTNGAFSSIVPYHSGGLLNRLKMKGILNE